jgi:hypothetical protein
MSYCVIIICSKVISFSVWRLIINTSGSDKLGRSGASHGIDLSAFGFSAPSIQTKGSEDKFTYYIKSSLHYWFCSHRYEILHLTEFIFFTEVYLVYQSTLMR